MKNFTKSFSSEWIIGVIASLALLIGISSMSQACFLTFNQPKIPQGLDKFRNNK